MMNIHSELLLGLVFAMAVLSESSTTQPGTPAAAPAATTTAAAATNSRTTLPPAVGGPATTPAQTPAPPTAAPTPAAAAAPATTAAAVAAAPTTAALSAAAPATTTAATPAAPTTAAPPVTAPAAVTTTAAPVAPTAAATVPPTTIPVVAVAAASTTSAPSASISIAAASSTVVMQSTAGADVMTTIGQVVSTQQMTTAMDATTQLAGGTIPNQGGLPAATTTTVDQPSTVATVTDASSVADTTPIIRATTVTEEPATTAAAAVRVCGVNIENVDESSPCHAKTHRVKRRGEGTNSPACDTDLEAGVWYLFEDSEETCQVIPIFNSDKCFKADSCDTEYPYYMQGPMLPAASGTNVTAELCTTDTTLSRTAVCCLDKAAMDIHSCGEYFVYRLAKPIRRKSCGKICLSKSHVIPPFTHLITNGADLPRKFANLTLKEKESVVIIVLSITEMKTFKDKWEGASRKFMAALENKVKDLSKNRTKRYATSSKDGFHAELLDGYPKVDETANKAAYATLVHDGKNNPVAKKDVEKAVEALKGGKSLDGSGATISGVESLPAELKALIPTPEPTKPPVVLKDGNLWVAIIIIIGVTGAIVAVSFLAVWCYNFSRKKRSGGMNVSQAKSGLMGGDELNNVYTPMEGHENMAMEEDAVIDSNQNANGKTPKKSSDQYHVEGEAVASL